MASADWQARELGKPLRVVGDQHEGNRVVRPSWRQAALGDGVYFWVEQLFLPKAIPREQLRTAQGWRLSVGKGGTPQEMRQVQEGLAGGVIMTNPRL